VGKDFKAVGHHLWLPDWSAGGWPAIQRSGHGPNPVGGTAQVHWNQDSLAADPRLEIVVSTLTIRQILEVFTSNQQQPASPHRRPLLGPAWVRTWTVEEGILHAVIHRGKSFEVLQAAVGGGDVSGLQGTFDLTPVNRMARFMEFSRLSRSIDRGKLLPFAGTGGWHRRAAVRPFFSAFTFMGAVFKRNASIAGERRYLKFFTTFYRIISVLNLGNYCVCACRNVRRGHRVPKRSGDVYAVEWRDFVGGSVLNRRI